jgi:hypothetical protein
MASTPAPYGARPIGTLSASGSFTSKTRLLEIASAYGTAIFNGDFVDVDATGTVVNSYTDENPQTALSTVGIFLGCQYTDPGSGQLTFSTQWPAGTVASDAKAFVLDDPMVLIQMQADGSVVVADRGLNAGIQTTFGSTSIGKSKNAVDQTSLATTATLPLRIIDFVDGPDSAVGDAATDVIVKFNQPSSSSASPHRYLNATGL